MKPIVLDATTKSIKAKIAGAPATTNPDFTSGYADNNGTLFTEGANDGALNGTTAVTIVAAPAGVYRRVVQSITVQNRDTASVVMTLYYDVSGTQRNIAVVTLLPGDTWTFTGVIDTNGNVKAAYGATAAAITSGTINGATIGATTPSTGVFTTITGTTITASTMFSGPHNGTVGATTPSTGAFTTVSATGAITSTLATGTAPFTVSSTTVVGNLNVSQLLGATWAAPGTIGSGTPNTAVFTTITGTTITASTMFSGPHNGTVGATTPSTGAFTTVSATTFTGALSGNATTATALATTRAIYGNNFDGSAALTQIIASTYGGTGNGFTKFSGPTTAERTKTLRDATDTILELGGNYTPTGTWTSLTLVTPALGTPASGVVTNLTGTASININGTVGATTPGTGAFTTLSASSTVSGTGFSTYLASPPAIGGTAAAAGTFTTLTDSIGDVRLIPQNSQSAAYTLVLGDKGKHIYHPSADTTARTWTIPANSSVAFPIGTAITFDNDNGAGVITIAITTDTMRLAGAGTTGSRTLAANGIATALKVTSTSWKISGTGLT